MPRRLFPQYYFQCIGCIIATKLGTCQEEPPLYMLLMHFQKYNISNTMTFNLIVLKNAQSLVQSIAHTDLQFIRNTYSSPILFPAFGHHVLLPSNPFYMIIYLSILINEGHLSHHFPNFVTHSFHISGTLSCHSLFSSHVQLLYFPLWVFPILILIEGLAGFLFVAAFRTSILGSELEKAT